MASDSFVNNPSSTDHGRLATTLEKKTWKRMTSLTRRIETLDTCRVWQYLAKKSTRIPYKTP